LNHPTSQSLAICIDNKDTYGFTLKSLRYSVIGHAGLGPKVSLRFVQTGDKVD
jgi:hypothetical protein